MFTERNALAILETAENMNATLRTLREIRPSLTRPAQEHFDLGLERLQALARTLQDIATAMGVHPSLIASTTAVAPR